MKWDLPVNSMKKERDNSLLHQEESTPKNRAELVSNLFPHLKPLQKQLLLTTVSSIEKYIQYTNRTRASEVVEKLTSWEKYLCTQKKHERQILVMQQTDAENSDPYHTAASLVLNLVKWAKDNEKHYHNQPMLHIEINPNGTYDHRKHIKRPDNEVLRFAYLNENGSSFVERVYEHEMQLPLTEHQSRLSNRLRSARPLKNESVQVVVDTNGASKTSWDMYPSFEGAWAGIRSNNKRITLNADHLVLDGDAAVNMSIAVGNNLEKKIRKNKTQSFLLEDNPRPVLEVKGKDDSNFESIVTAFIKSIDYVNKDHIFGKNPVVLVPTVPQEPPEFDWRRRRVTAASIPSRTKDGPITQNMVRKLLEHARQGEGAGILHDVFSTVYSEMLPPKLKALTIKLLAEIPYTRPIVTAIAGCGIVSMVSIKAKNYEEFKQFTPTYASTIGSIADKGGDIMCVVVQVKWEKNTKRYYTISGTGPYNNKSRLEEFKSVFEKQMAESV